MYGGGEWCSSRVVLHSIRLNQDMFCLTNDYSLPLTLNITTLEISSSSTNTTPASIQRAARGYIRINSRYANQNKDIRSVG